MKIDETENDKKIYREIIYQEKRCLNKDDDTCEEIMIKDIYYGDEKDEPLNTIEPYLKNRNTLEQPIKKETEIMKAAPTVTQDKEEINADPAIRQDKVAIRKLGYKLLNKLLVILLTSTLIILNVVLPSIDYLIQKLSASTKAKTTQQQITNNSIESEETNGSTPNKQIDVSLFPFEINVLPVFTNGGRKGNIEIKNPENSNYWVNVKIYIKDTNEFIYESGLLKPGQEIAEASLDKTLAAGSYEAIAYLDVYELDSKTYLGRTSVLISILIQD